MMGGCLGWGRGKKGGFLTGVDEGDGVGDCFFGVGFECRGHVGEWGFPFECRA